MEMKSQVLEGGNLLNRIAIAREGHDQCRHGCYYHDLCLGHTDLHLQSSTIGSQGINQGLKLFWRGSQETDVISIDQLPEPHLQDLDSSRGNSSLQVVVQAINEEAKQGEPVKKIGSTSLVINNVDHRHH